MLQCFVLEFFFFLGRTRVAKFICVKLPQRGVGARLCSIDLLLCSFLCRRTPTVEDCKNYLPTTISLFFFGGDTCMMSRVIIAKAKLFSEHCIPLF